MEDNKTLEMDVMETETDLVEVEDTEMEYSEETNSGSGWKLALAGLAGAAAIGAVAYKKIKAKKSGKPKRKMRLRWVDVSEENCDDEFEDEDIIDGETEIIEEEPEEKSN